MAPDGRMVVVARGLVKRYGDLVAVDGVDFVVRPGECYGLRGPNGAGKTSTIKMLYGLARVAGGGLRVRDCDARTERRQLKGGVGVVPQDATLGRELTIRENLAMQAIYHGREPDGRIDELIAFALLAGRDRDRVQSLSGGMRR